MQSFTLWLLVFLRVSALLSVFPVLSARSVPAPLRLALAALLAVFISAAVPLAVPDPRDLWSLVGVMGAEVATGLLLGFVARLVFFIAEFAGAVVGFEMGLSLPQSINPFSASQETLPALILYYLAVVLFLTLDLHQWLLVGIQKSYQFVPIGGARLSETLALDLIRRTADIFSVGLRMAAPVIAVSFIVTLVFSLLSRTVPQMNVFVESFAVRAMAGLAVFGLSCHLMAQHIANYLRRLPEDVLQVARMLGGA